MRQTILVLAGVLLCVVALGSDSPKEYDDRTEAQDIQGTWELTEIELQGEKVKSDSQEMMTFRGESFTANSQSLGIHRGNYRTYLTHKPYHLDLSYTDGDTKGPTLKLIFQIDGEMLRIAETYLPNDKQRPQGFNGAVEVWTYKRVK